MLAFAATGCASVGANTELAAKVLGEPHPDDYLPVLSALARGFVPFEHPKFPRSVQNEHVEAALLAHFPVRSSPEFAGFRKALVMFDDVSLFPARLAPLVDDARSAGATDDDIDRALTHDRAMFDVRSYPARFRDAQLDAQRSYLALWARSAFVTRRRFYRGAKAMVMIATYSLEPMWRAIGYEGPLLRS